MKVVKFRIHPVKLMHHLMDPLNLTPEETRLPILDVYASFEQYGEFVALLQTNNNSPKLDEIKSVMVTTHSTLPPTEVVVYNRRSE